jgi:hypothetical protein
LKITSSLPSLEESDAIVRPELVKISREFKQCSRTLKLASGGVAGAEIQKYLYIFFYISSL